MSSLSLLLRKMGMRGCGCVEGRRGCLTRARSEGCDYFDSFYHEGVKGQQFGVLGKYPGVHGISPQHRPAELDQETGVSINNSSHLSTAFSPVLLLLLLLFLLCTALYVRELFEKYFSLSEIVSTMPTEAC